MRSFCKKSSIFDTVTLEGNPHIVGGGGEDEMITTKIVWHKKETFGLITHPFHVFLSDICLVPS